MTACKEGKMDITLDEIKLQCRVDGDEENELLNVFLTSAKAIVENYTNRQLFSVLPPDNVPHNALEITADLKVAILMLVAYLYENRSGFNESATMQFVGTILKLPPTVEMIVSRYTYIPL